MAPAPVDAEAEEMIEQVVPARDRIEHPRDLLRALVRPV
jgi:hypothetical protein